MITTPTVSSRRGEAPDGDISSEVYPSGLIATWHYDNTGNVTSLSYIKSGATWMAFTNSYNAQDQVVGQAASATGYNTSSQAFGYDGDGRLTSVADTYSGACTTRQYGYDVDTNRTSMVAYPAGTGGACSTSTTATTTSYTYDQADRLENPGYSYDVFGRTLTVPASDTTGTGTLTLGYYTNDFVSTQAQNGDTQSFTIDPTDNRVRTQTDSGSGVTITNHYTDGSDTPAWTASTAGGWTRNIEGLDGNLAAIESSTGTSVLQLPNIQGSIVATAADSTSATALSSYAEYTEFGAARTAGTTPALGYLGAKRKSSADLGGLTIMGQRLYNSATGRFLQTDPVPGGSANGYDYCRADPINCTDLNGQWGWHHHWGWHHWRHAFGRGLSDAGFGMNWLSTAMPGPQAALGGEIGTIWEVAGDRLQMNHYTKADRATLLDDFEYGSTLDMLSAGLSSFGARFVVHFVQSINNLPTRSAAMGSSFYRH